jgi:hypothetical protein
LRPPIVAEALVAALGPPNDYESIAGDLHEEYLRYVRLRSTRAANCWYWWQVLLSIPWLLSYSRAHRSALHAIGVGVTVIAVLVAMILATVPINALLQAIFGSPDRWPLSAQFCADWIDAVVFGAVLVLVVRSGGVRLAFWAALLLVLGFAVPALLGFPSSQAPLPAWILLGGTVPAMCAGAALYQVAIRHGNASRITNLPRTKRLT